MIDDGLFDGLDAALLYHPCDRSHVESHPLASEDVDVVFSGLQSHASSDPWRGKNALDAMILLFTSVGLWRQQLRPTARVHGIIREGGTAANIIPDRTSAWFMIRSDDEADYERMRDRFARAVRGRRAGHRHDGRGDLLRAAPGRCATTAVLADRFRANMAAYGIEDQGDDPNAGSTDMANVSWVCPTIHPDLAIAPEGTPGHSILFRDAAATPRADEVDPAGGHARRPDRARAVRRPGARGRRLARVPRRTADRPTGPGCYHRPRRVPLDDGFRTGGAPSETDLTARIVPPRPSPEDPRG